jgi:hypothetical protein
LRNPPTRLTYLSALRFAPPRSFSVKVDNLSYDTTTDELKGVFEKHGEVADVSSAR